MDDRTHPPAGFFHVLWTAKLHVQRIVMFTTSCIFTLLVFAQVIMRYLLDVPMYGVEEVAAFSAVWMYFIGGAHGAYGRGHISASLIEVMLPAGWRRQFIRTLSSLITTVLAGWMTMWAIQYLEWTIRKGTMSVELGVKMVWVHMSMPIGLALMTLYFALEFLEDAATLVRGSQVTSRLLGARR